MRKDRSTRDGGSRSRRHSPRSRSHNPSPSDHGSRLQRSAPPDRSALHRTRGRQPSPRASHQQEHHRDRREQRHRRQISSAHHLGRRHGVVLAHRPVEVTEAARDDRYQREPRETWRADPLGDRHTGAHVETGATRAVGRARVRAVRRAEGWLLPHRESVAQPTGERVVSGGWRPPTGQVRGECEHEQEWGQARWNYVWARLTPRSNLRGSVTKERRRRETRSSPPSCCFGVGAEGLEPPTSTV